jgi:hypothetical protein
LAQHDRHGLRCGCVDYPMRNAESEARGVWQPKKVLKKDFYDVGLNEGNL